MEKKIVKGSKVAGQPSKWFDGTPVSGWPDPQFVGTVLRIIDNAGIPTARVKWKGGRLDWVPINRLTLVPGDSE